MTTSSVAKNTIVITISLLRSSTRRSFHATRPAWRRSDMLVGVTMIDVFELLVGIRVGTFFEYEAASAQDRDVIGAAGDRFEIVGHDDDDRAARLELAELLAE